MLLLTVILAMAATEAPSPAAAPAEPGLVVREVRFAPLKRDWSQYASLGRAGPFYPDQAAQNGIQGDAIIQCKIAADGALDDCKDLFERPKGSHFGGAARAMAEKRRIFVADDVAVGEVVALHVPFRPGEKVEYEARSR